MTVMEMCSLVNRKLKQRRRQRQQKRHPKSEFALFLFQTSLLLLQLSICQMLAIFFQELNSKGLNLSSQKEKENRCHVLPSSTKREIRTFKVVGAVTAKKCTKRHEARAKLLFC